MIHDLIHDWNDAGDAPRRPARRIEFDDETLRDGLQSPSAVTPRVDQRLEILRLMDAMGIDTADIGLPGAGAAVAEDTLAIARAMAAEKMKIAPNCAARTLEEDLRPIAEIAQKTGRPVAAAMSRANPKDLEVLFLTALEAGASRLCLCDTCGHATPHGVAQLVGWTRRLLESRKLGHVRLDFHGHMDRGLGVWNSIAALQAGAHRLHGTALGIGERVGNAPMDQILVNLKLMGWIENDLTRLTEYCRKVSDYAQIPIPHGYPVVGRDAFETATGVHAAAIVKAMKKGDAWLADRVYSGVPAGDFGRVQEIAIGPMSGKSNVIHWLQLRGHAATDPLVAAILDRAKHSNRLLSDEEILDVVRKG
ncbi:MAG: 2-isopropylmalate synthase [Planctomycetes bacterium]|nr:2-isopropylmalate synthase [Planctomycetota bacterium]